MSYKHLRTWTFLFKTQQTCGTLSVDFCQRFYTVNSMRVPPNKINKKG
jgi:hypothetical protein